MYTSTKINGVGIIIDGVMGTTGFPYTVAQGAICSLVVWVSVRGDAPSADVLTLHTQVKRVNRPGGSVAYSDSRDSPLLDPDTSYMFDEVGPFTIDGYGNWTLDLSLDSLVDDAQVDVIANWVILNVPRSGIDLGSIMPMMIVVMMMGMMIPMLGKD